MFNIICVTNRSLCKDNFFNRIDTIARTSATSIILREKDLQEHEYYELAKEGASPSENHKVSECLAQKGKNQGVYL